MNKVEMRNVVSSNITRVGYSEKRKLLFVEFTGGNMYEYSGASKEVYDGLLSSPSVGRSLRVSVAGLNYRNVPVQEREQVLYEEAVGVALEEDKTVTNMQVRNTPKTTNILKVLLAYYQGDGDVVENPVKSVFGNDCTVGARVFSVFEELPGGKKKLLPVLYRELDLLDMKYYCNDLLLDEEGVGILVLKQRVEGIPGYVLEAIENETRVVPDVTKEERMPENKVD